MSNNLGERLIKGIASNVLGQLINVIIQVGSVPLFIHFWGVNLYGEWLILNSVPAYFSMCDIGFASIATNEMNMLVAQNDRSQALEVFQSSWLFISSVSGVIALVVLAAIWFIPLERSLNLTQQTHFEVAAIVLVLTFYVLTGLQNSLLVASFRCEGNYALGALCSNLLRLSEYSVSAIAVVFGATPLLTACLFLLVRGTGTFGIWLILKRKSPWIVCGYKQAKLTTARRLAVPSIAYMGFPLGNALINQGIVTVIGVVLGSTAVVVFSTVRTLSRIAFQATAAINNTVWSEISTAYGTGNLELARKLHRYSCQASLWLSTLAVASLFVTGEWIIQIWTRSKVTVDASFLHIMLTVIVTNSFWYTSSIVPIAINQHRRMALRYLISTSLAVLLARWLTVQFGLNGAAVALLSVDVLMSLYVVKTSLALLHDNFASFLTSLFVPPTVFRYNNK